MKKLALALIATGSLIATPVFACPHSDKAEATDTAPRTAEKDKAKEQPKAKDTKTKTAKPADKAKAKKPEKVSRK